MELCRVVWILSFVSLIQGMEHFISVTQLNNSLSAVRNSELDLHLQRYILYQERLLEAIERYSNTINGFCNHNGDGISSTGSKTQSTAKTARNSTFIVESATKLLKEIQTFETVHRMDKKDGINVHYGWRQSYQFDPNILDELTEKHPTTLDLKGAAGAIVRIQNVYNVSYGEVMNGVMFGTKAMPLSAEEGADMGLLCYVIGKHFEAMQWFRVTLQLYQRPSARARMIRKYAETATEYDNPIDATRLTAKLHQTVSCRKHRLLAKRERQTLTNLFKTSSPEEIQRMRSIGNERRAGPQTQNYYNLCSNNGRIEPLPQERLLVCRLQHHGNPWLKLRPLKEEELNLDPPLVLYHKAYPAPLLDRIQQHAKSRLKRSVVGCMTGQCPTSRRISSDYFFHEKHELALKMDSLTTTYSKTKQDTVEFVMAINYGMGGFFRIHYDFHKHVGNEGDMDNRIVSILVYMSELEDGSGATVFTNMKLRVQPERGSVVIWNNLYKNGSNHMMSAHAGCPVISGNKWLMALMINSYGNEFTRPCSLNEYE